VEGGYHAATMNIPGYKDAFVSFVKGLRKWGVKVRALVEVDEEAIMESVDMST
jgi:hypothetical protein